MLFEHRLHIDFVEKINPAAQVETEVHLFLRQKARPILHPLCGEQVGNSKDHTERADSQNERDQPSGEVEHRRDLKRRPPVACPLTLSLSRQGRGDAPRQSSPLPSWEREGPIAQRWEGEGAGDGSCHFHATCPTCCRRPGGYCFCPSRC